MHQSSSNEGVAPWSHHIEGRQGRARGAGYPPGAGWACWPLYRVPARQSSLSEGVAPRNHHTKGMQGVPGGASHPPGLGHLGPLAPLWGPNMPKFQRTKVAQTRGWLLGAITQKGGRGEPEGRATSLGRPAGPFTGSQHSKVPRTRG